MSNEKLCVDCRWCESLHGRPTCQSPKNKITEKSLVTGEDKTVYRFKHCGTQRLLGGIHAVLSSLCGKQGRWFEAKVEENVEKGE